VEVRISVLNGDRVTELESLDDWLRGEPDLAGRVNRAGLKPGIGELGALADALVVSVGSGGTLSVLALSLNTWLSHARRSHVRIRVEGDSGQVVEIQADHVNAKSVETLVQQVIRSDPRND
jgi:hypothetical protein